MQSSRPPKAAEKRWQQWLRDNYESCLLCGAPATELQHVLGSTAKHNKVEIGQWATYMSCTECNHDSLRRPTKRGELDLLLNGPALDYQIEFMELPWPDNVHMAIQGWHR